MQSNTTRGQLFAGPSARADQQRRPALCSSIQHQPPVSQSPWRRIGYEQPSENRLLEFHQLCKAEAIDHSPDQLAWLSVLVAVILNGIFDNVCELLESILGYILHQWYMYWIALRWAYLQDSPLSRAMQIFSCLCYHQRPGIIWPVRA